MTLGKKYYFCGCTYDFFQETLKSLLSKIEIPSFLGHHQEQDQSKMVPEREQST